MRAQTAQRLPQKTMAAATLIVELAAITLTPIPTQQAQRIGAHPSIHQ
jgi:hypothetical protein